MRKTPIRDIYYDNSINYEFAYHDLCRKVAKLLCDYKANPQYYNIVGATPAQVLLRAWDDLREDMP